MRALPFALRQRIINGSLEYLHEAAYEKIRKQGFQPGGILDIGASQGTWATAISRFFPGVPILMIEPREGERELLTQTAKRLGGDIELALLGAEEREVTFWDMGSGSSVYYENSGAERTSRQMTMKTLDAVMASKTNLFSPLFIKVDAQGSELDILKGGQKTLQQTELVQLEVSLMNYNAGAPTAYDVFDFMRAAEFSIFELAGANRRSERLVQVDVVFVRTHSKLRRSFF